MMTSRRIHGGDKGLPVRFGALSTCSPSSSAASKADFFLKAFSGKNP
jgi:hypothetical protein